LVFLVKSEEVSPYFPFKNLPSIGILFIKTLFFQGNVFSQYFWEERVVGVSVSLNCVSNIDGLNAWICGDSSTVIKTTNYGYIWINVSYNGIPVNTKLVSIAGINSNIALTAGFKNDTAYLYRTSNGVYFYRYYITNPNTNEVVYNVVKKMVLTK